jgi:hypothetical protein
VVSKLVNTKIVSFSGLKAWLVPLKKREPELLVRFEISPGQQM